uniref:Si:ch73-290k24.5 n=1 Tax=Sphaeramia orbicularis TaxID=375764 RepID=A0A672ZB62_9TELE
MLPYFCPRCGDDFRFSSVPELRAHLVSRHTYETLLVLSSRPGALLPLPGPAVAQTQSSSLGMEPRSLPLPLACLDLASSSNVELELGMAVRIGLEERLGLGLDRKITRTFAEVEERVNQRLSRLKVELQKREAELEQQRLDRERLRGEKQEVEDRAAYLSRQVRGANDSRLGSVVIFQAFIEMLLERADRAERHLLLLNTHTHHNHYTNSDTYIHADSYGSVNIRGGRSLDGSVDDILHNKMQETIGNRVREPEHTWKMNMRKKNTMAPVIPLYVLSSVPSSPSCRHGERGLGPDALRLRAGLFCVFPYLDVRSLLRVAEVCSDWRFVARHPAVWTRLHLENSRISAEFLITLSQWCTQTQTVVLNNLKPRSRRTNETREDYHRNIRGSVEPGVEALLRSAGGSLLHLSVSQCPHILTDRTLWLASCYCRNLSALTYRSSSDPLGQEVLWALGAGCRNISSLQVAPAHPCQQPTRFGNRCLQTIGRCWPHLSSLSVGGASCDTQGLVGVVRSCSKLQLLELERITDLGLQAATQLCEAGLKTLHTLILTHTPVSGQAILHFHSVCANIRSIVVQVSAADYFEEPDTQEAQHLFGEILSTLKVNERSLK